MKIYLLTIYILLSILPLSAQTSEAAVTFDWAIIGNPSNTADNTGHGSVSYEYKIATTEVTTAQYVKFLNSVAATDTYGLYQINMTNSTYYKGITRTGNSGNYEYSANAGWENRPVVYVSWYDTLRFANWLHNGQPTGLQNASTTEYGAYDMSLGDSVVRLTGADYWLPSENEWYKAAYYDPDTGVYYNYATGSNITPTATLPTGDTGNSANYYDDGFLLGSPYYSTEVGAYDESESPYGTYDQSGNVWEWNETLLNDQYRGLRGASWSSHSHSLPATSTNNVDCLPDGDLFSIGFRVASSLTAGNGESIPEPTSIILLGLVIGSLVRKIKK